MSVHVQNLDHMRLFRMDLKLFMERVRNALDEARNEVAKLKWWLQYDRLPYWQKELRRREAKLNEAKGNLLGARLADNSETQFAERQAVRKAEQAVEEAKRKVELIKHRLRSFDNDIAQAQNLCRKLYSDVDHLLPMAVQSLDAMIETLEDYAEDAPPEAVVSEPTAEDEEPS